MDVSKYQPFDAYRLKFERITAVNQKENSWQQQNAGVVKQVENIITDKLSYPYSAYAAVVVDAEDFGQIPKRSYVIRGLKIKVPTNYFPADEIHDDTGARRATASYSRNVTTGADTGNPVDWDGNFRGDQKTFNATSPNYMPVYTSNPVWIFMDLITNPRSRKIAHLNNNPSVSINFQSKDRKSYVSINGEAELINDISLKTKYWKNEWTPFYSDIENDCVLIKINPQILEIVSSNESISSDPVTWRPLTLIINN